MNGFQSSEITSIYQLQVLCLHTSADKLHAQITTRLVNIISNMFHHEGMDAPLPLSPVTQ